MKFLNKVRRELRPDNTVLIEVDRFVSKINKLLKNVDAKCVRGGSTAKGTFLKGDFDIDLFVIFDNKYKGKDISDILEKAIKRLRSARVHGSRDYFQLKRRKIMFEIVPVLEVKNVNDIENITDMSPHHAKWANKHLNKNLRDDIRLAKKFCKAQKVYGAESYIKGFSGHVLDILIIKYGGFEKLIRAAARWKPKVIIDVEKRLKDPLNELNKAKTKSPMIVVDPVQSDRNAAAALSKEKFERFVESAKAFIKKPLPSFFVETEFDVKKMDKGKNVLLVLNVKTLKGKQDVVGAKILKTYEYIKKNLKEFDVVDSDWKWDDKKRKAQAYFLVKEKLLSKTFVRQGPPLSQKKACKSFKEKNKDSFVKDKIMFANVKRDFRKPKQLIKNLIKDNYVEQKVEKISLK